MNDFISETVARMRADGLVVSEPETDGLLHRCGTEGKVRGTDGAYIIHADKLQVAWWRNWVTDTENTYCAKAQAEMTARERKRFNERMEAMRKAAREEREKRQEAAAKLARSIWEKASPADDSHPYLKSKEVRAFGLKVGARDVLLVPVLDMDGNIQTLQEILTKRPINGTNKRFLAGGNTKGGFYSIAARDGSTDSPLLIAEGYATAASLHMATGLEATITFNAGNMLAVAKLARAKYPARKICLCADYDVPHNEKEAAKYTEPGGVGVAKATEAAQAIAGLLAIAPAIDGGSADFNDIHCRYGLLRVQEVIERALAEQPANSCPMPEGYRITLDGKNPGLFYYDAKQDGTGSEVWLGPPLEVLGETRDIDGNDWGLMLRWHDNDRRQHTWAMPKTLLYSQGGEWFASLAYGGWSGNPACRKLISGFFSRVKPVKKIQCVARTGWHDDNYVLPDRVYGHLSDNTEIVLQSLCYEDLYGIRGSFVEWLEIAELCKGNSRLVFALSCAFAGPFLAIAGLESGGFSFTGQSSSGKSTAMHVAASVWGSEAHKRQWRTTDNALESVAALANDNLLILDELGQAGTRALDESIYMLANGAGKSRARKDGTLRRPQRWKALLLSSGEIGLAARLAEDGRKPKAGQEVRFCDVPFDKGQIKDLHGMKDGGELVRRLLHLTSCHYGHAGRLLLERLTEPETLAMERETARQEIEKLARSFCPADSDGQVSRVALRFALVGYAGEKAEEWDILPAGFYALDATVACFEDWLEQRGGAGALEDTAILEQVRLFIEMHGQSRFQEWDDINGKVINRVGLRKEATYYCFSEAFKSEIIRGFTLKKAISVLSAAGWMQTEGGKALLCKRLPDMGIKRVYIIQLPDES